MSNEKERKYGYVEEAGVDPLPDPKNPVAPTEMLEDVVGALMNEVDGTESKNDQKRDQKNSQNQTKND